MQFFLCDFWKRISEYNYKIIVILANNNIMFEEKYEILFEGTSLDSGKLFWYILKAKTELDKRLQVPSKNNKEQVELSKLELQDDEIRWWITKKEKNIYNFKEKKNIP